MRDFYYEEVIVNEKGPVTELVAPLCLQDKVKQVIGSRHTFEQAAQLT